MTSNIRQIATLFVAVALIATAAGGALAAGVDTETTNTPETSELTEGTVISTAYNGTLANSNELTLTATMTTTDGEVRIQDPDTGETIRTLTTDDADEQTFSGTDLYYYNYTVNDSRLANFPIESNETKDVRFKIVDNATLDDQNETYSYVNATITAEKGYTYLRVGESVAGSDDVTFDSNGFSVAGFDFGVDNYTEIERTSVATNGSGSTVTMHLTNSTAVDSFDAAAENLDSGTWAFATPVQVGDEWARTYVESAPSDINESETYGVYDPSANELTIHQGDDVDKSSIDITATGNDALGIYQSFQAFGLDGIQKAATSAV